MKPIEQWTWRDIEQQAKKVVMFDAQLIAPWPILFFGALGFVLIYFYQMYEFWRNRKSCRKRRPI